MADPCMYLHLLYDGPCPPQVGMDVGQVAASVVASTGRLHYRGKVMNRCVETVKTMKFFRP